MNNISDISPKECFGCTACMAVCPVKAVQMMADKEGFMAPMVDETNCINCGKCKSVCPAINRWSADKVDNHFYGFKNIDTADLEKSTSGGAFTACVKYVKPDNVCGCVEDEQLYVRHVITDATKIEPMMGSKYVQSDICDCYSAIKNKLFVGESVLFTGTSCQVHGLLNFLKAENIDTEKLFTMDLICHGVPSNKMHKEYVEYYEDRKKSKLIYHKFRTKSHGWGTRHILKNYGQTLVHDMGKVDYTSLESQLYVNIFFSDLCLREACYNCPYCTENKPSDVTMADFWGIEETDLELDTNSGCSLLIGRNKGKRVLDDIQGGIELTKMQANIAKEYQKHLYLPNDRPVLRDDFWSDYSRNGFAYVANKYLHMSTKYKLLFALFNVLNKCGIKSLAARIERYIYF